MAGTKRSRKPLPETLAKLLEDQAVSQREMTRRCQSRGWGSLRTTTELLSGELRPTVKAMEAIATALQVLPEVFTEYRLAKMRAMLDPDQVPFKRAVKNLETFEAVIGASGADPTRHPVKAPRRRPTARGGRGGSS